MSKRKVQPTLGAFGIKRTVVHRGEEVQVQIPDFVENEVKIPCPSCSQTFKSKQGLAIHRLTKHPTNSDSEQPVPPIMLPTNSQPADTPAVPVETVASPPVAPPAVTELDVERDETATKNKAKSDGAKLNAGRKRHAFPAFYKARALNELDQGATQDIVALKYGVNQAQISRWKDNREKIMKETADSHRKLHKKIRKSVKYQVLYAKLFEEFIRVRSKGHVVNFASLWAKARKIQRELDPSVEIKNHVIVRFLQKYKIRMRAKQRNKKKPKVEKVPDLQKWHATFREKCIRTGKGLPGYDEKYGRFKPEERLNVDQSPLPFVVHGNRTYEFIPEGQGSTHNTHISQPGSGLEKRQCTLQIVFRCKGKQPRLSIIFRGQGIYLLLRKWPGIQMLMCIFRKMPDLIKKFV